MTKIINLDDASNEQKIMAITYGVLEDMKEVDTSRVNHLSDLIQDMLEENEVTVAEFYTLMIEVISKTSDGYLDKEVIIKSLKQVYDYVTELQKKIEVNLAKGSH